jgi:uncharacterized protein YndB with AHSA1/START domain
MSTMPTSPPRAYVKRIVHAPAADVFAAWTDPAAMAQWMTPSGTASAEVDLRVGGRFRLVMADEHLRIEHTGEYQVIQPPELLVFTWRSEFTGMQDTRVTVRLTERGSDQTEIEVTHELATEAEASSHAGGWGQLLIRLQAFVKRT